MALQLKEGDLFAHIQPPCIIFHGVNAQGKMNAGFAKKLRENFPDAYKTYKQAHAAGDLKLGEINGYVDVRGFVIVNGVTQQFYGRDKDVVYVSYEAVKQCSDTVARFVLEKGGPDYPVHLPLIGGGLANGDRETLLGIFQEAFKHVNATLWELPAQD